MNSPKVSIVTPVYNAEAFLDRCIQSVINQSFKSFELILVDDGSIDNSREICERYAELDSRIRYYYKKNGGSSSARNLALDHACGEYVLMLDSDDWIDTDCLDVCYRIARENRLDFLDYSYRIVDANGIVKSEIIHTETDVLTLEEYVNNKQSILKGSCGTFYKLSTIGKTRYDLRFIANEDELFFIQVMSKANRIKIIPNIYYNVFINENSISHQDNYFRKQYDSWMTFNSFIPKYPIEKRWFDEHSLIVSNCSIKYKVDSWRNIRKKYISSNVNYKNIKWERKRFAIIAHYNFYLYALFSIVDPILRSFIKSLIKKYRKYSI